MLDAVCHVWGSDRVGLRLSPLNSYNSMIDSDPVALVSWLGRQLNAYKLAYLHVMRSDFLGQQSGDVMTPVRDAFDGVLIGNMGYSAVEAAAAIDADRLDAVAFGTIGDSSTSEGLFWESMNAAAVLQVPMCMSVWDNGWGISVPKKYQTVKESISEALSGFEKKTTTNGIKILKVKG